MQALIHTDNGCVLDTYSPSRVRSIGSATTIRGWDELDGPAHYINDRMSTVIVTVPDAELVACGLLPSEGE